MLRRWIANLGFLAVFTKLASQLDGDKFIELGVIPVIFVVMTAVSYGVAVAVTKLFRFNKRASNFVIAMGVRLPFPR